MVQRGCALCVGVLPHTRAAFTPLMVLSVWRSARGVAARETRQLLSSRADDVVPAHVTRQLLDAVQKVCVL